MTVSNLKCPSLNWMGNKVVPRERRASLVGMLFYIKEEMKMDYKDTLLMPKTAFEMRGKLPSKEPLIQKRWQDEDLYGKMMKKRDGAPK